MLPHTYEKSIPYASGDQLLLEVRETVQELRRAHPELERFALADLGLQREQALLNVTLYFEPKS